MTSTIVALALLALGTFAMKAVGPVLAAGRELPGWLARTAALLPPALLAALVAAQTFTAGSTLVIDARAVGLAAAAVAVALRAPFAVVVLLAAGVTAAVRAAGWG